MSDVLVDQRIALRWPLRRGQMFSHLFCSRPPDREFLTPSHDSTQYHVSAACASVV